MRGPRLLWLLLLAFRAALLGAGEWAPQASPLAATPPGLGACVWESPQAPLDLLASLTQTGRGTDANEWVWGRVGLGDTPGLWDQPTLIAHPYSCRGPYQLGWGALIPIWARRTMGFCSLRAPPS